MRHWQSNLCAFSYPSTAEQEQCPKEGPKTTSEIRYKFVGDDEGKPMGVIVGTVVGCTAVVALIVVITILVSQL